MNEISALFTSFAPTRTQEGFDEWAKEWVFGIYSRSDYLEKVGKETIARITNPKFAEDRLFE